MIGGLFKSSSVAAIAAAGLLSGGVAAKAADLGGNCCADLEERVAELEATTARKGNTKVSLTVSGAVAHSIIWHDSDAPGNIRGNRLTVTDSFGVNQSAFRFTGSAQINADWSAGFKMQIDVDTDAGLASDDAYLYIKSKTYGTIQMGRLEGAIDGINSISLGARPDIALDDDTANSTMLGGGGGFYNGVGDFDGNDDEGQGLKYISPSIGGFSVSASWVSNAADAGNEQADIYGAALRYAGEFGAIRVAAGVGFEIEEDGDDNTEQQTVSGSVSVMHVPSGIFVNFAAGEKEDTTAGVAGGVTQTGYHALVGIKTKLTSLGATTFSAHMNWYDREDTLAANVGNPGFNYDSTVWGLGVVQSIDAAAMSMYLNFQQHECVTQVSGATCTDDANVVSFGAGIKF